MENLKASLIVAIGLVLFSSCTPKYGCPYGLLDKTEIKPAPIKKVLPVERTTANLEIVAIVR